VLGGPGSIHVRSTDSKPALRITQPHIRWTSAALLFREQKARDMELTTHLRLILRSRIVELQLYSPILLHGMVLNILSTDRT
jgi:hypothetical protein